MAVFGALCWESIRNSSLFHSVLLLAGTWTTALFVIGLTVYYRRRSRTYLLIVLALGALVVRTVVGAGTAAGVVPMGLHHLLGHGLDLGIAVALLFAIYRNGSVTERAPDGG